MKEKNKFLILPFLLVIIIAIIFLSSQIPVVNMEAENMPIGILNEDNGEMGSGIYNTLLENAPDAIHFKEYESMSAMRDGMDDRDIYGGLVIPEHFSGQIASLQTESPGYANLKIFINEGSNPKLASKLETILQGITNKIGANMGNRIIQRMEGVEKELSEKVHKQVASLQGMLGDKLPQELEENLGQLSSNISPIKAKQVTLLANPIQAETIKVNKAGDLATVPNALFITVWISSLLGAILLYFSGKNKLYKNKREKYKFKVIQSLLPILYSFFAGYLITWFSTWILDYHFTSFHTVALLLSFALLGFVYLIFATLTWLGLPSIGLYGVLMFFGLPLIQLAPEMLPGFYQNYVLPWLPMRFLVEGLKEVIFYGKGVMNYNTIVLLSIAGASFIIIWIKNILIKPVKSE